MAKTVTYTAPAGKTEPLYRELLQQKHLLIAGASGSGKSVLANALIYTALHDLPTERQLILIDPKRVELLQYRDLPHTLGHYTEMPDILAALQWALDEIERRYKTMAAAGLKLYGGGHIYIVIDEFADLMTVAKKQVVPMVQRISQIGRAANVHLWLCTQCPLAAVIPTTIKCNFDSVVGLHTARRRDSLNIMGVGGCELLPHHGEALYISPDRAGISREIIPMIPQTEIDRVVTYWRAQTAASKGGGLRAWLRGICSSR